MRYRKRGMDGQEILEYIANAAVERMRVRIQRVLEGRDEWESLEESWWR